MNVSLENAKKAAAPALAEAEKNHWNMAVAIVDTSGNLVYYEKMDNTQLGSANVAIEKARTAALFKRPTKAFQDVLAAGGDGLRVLTLKGVVAVEVGIPLVMDGKIVGAIGVSGAASGARRAVREGGRGRFEVKPRSHAGSYLLDFFSVRTMASSTTFWIRRSRASGER